MLKSIAFIGAGNMAEALITGLLQAKLVDADRITAIDLREERLNELSAQYGLKTSPSLDRLSTNDVVVLSVKPQSFEGLLEALSGKINRESVIISIAAGITLSTIEAKLPQNKVIRAMPNTPALVGMGATAIAQGKLADDRDMESAKAIFSSVGLCLSVNEKDMDAVTALSGSGPAYAFRFIELLAEHGKDLGLAEDIANALAVQTVLGAATLVDETKQPPQALRQKVSSPGGTTVAGLAALEQAGFSKAIESCLNAAHARSKELSKG
ncbi:MAG: pyrroline-5-carboxylate reductase [Myxococcales bacterium]|nr:MAG: pyrroline-5-carboxylate reductase [Myxococcales bacterium]